MNLLTLFETHSHWQEVERILNRLINNGFKSYLAGGCVRDALLHKAIRDFDIATEAHPNQVEQLFPEAIGVGRQFGVMIVPVNDFQVEVATFRSDGQYIDGRHPESIIYSNPKADAERRDFTVNALFYDVQEHRVVDYVNGLKDLKENCIRTVGDAESRFKEDKLRLMRAARFSGQLEFNIHPETLQAMTNLSAKIQSVSKERITDEYKKISTSKNPTRSFEILQSTGLLSATFPLFRFNESDLWPKFLSAIILSAPVASFEFMLAQMIIFELVASDKNGINTTISSRDLPLVLSSSSKTRIDFLTKGFFHFQKFDDPFAIEEALLLLDHDNGPLLSELTYNLATLGLAPTQNIVSSIEKFLALSDARGQLPQALLTGDDLIELGIAPSRQIGELLKLAYFAQLRHEIKTVDQAKAWVRSQV